MKSSRPIHILIVTVALGSISLSRAFGAADNQPKEKPQTLRNIMKEMGRNLQVVTDGISREDWKLVVETAPLITDHPQPPSQPSQVGLVFAAQPMIRIFTVP